VTDTQVEAVTGYPLATKVLHWLTVLVLAAQLVVGYTLDVEDGRDRVEDALDARADRAGSEAEEERLEELADAAHDRARDQDAGAVLDRVSSRDEPVLTTHVVLGLTLLLLALVRLVRRRVVPLPPWAETLTEGERRLAHRTEQVLYLTLVLMPLSGLGVLLVEDGLLPVHVATHVTFFVAVTLHVGLVLKHQLVDRDRLLRRML
jgi:cytochrome b561